jgi:hypothetical protein
MENDDAAILPYREIIEGNWGPAAPVSPKKDEQH